MKRLSPTRQPAHHHPTDGKACPTPAPTVSPVPTPQGSPVTTRSHPGHQRILHAVFSSRIAGSERYCADLANHQASLGHEVHVAGNYGSTLEHILAPAVRFHGLRAIFRDFRLHRLMDHLQPDICHAHLSKACKAFGRASARHHTVATLHVGYKPHQHARLHGVICVNHSQTKRLDDYSGIVRTIGNWLPTAPELYPPGVRSELGLSPGTFLIGAIGRLHPSKGNDTLIAAFQAAAPPHAALVILGEGPQRKKLEKMRGHDSRIHFLGYRPVVYGCLRDLDLFVSPSREESFGLAILEAMSVGVPIISTATEGPAEFLAGQPVQLVPPDCISSLKNAIRVAHDDFLAGHLQHPDYQLNAFHATARIEQIMDFYTQVQDATDTSTQSSLVRQQAIA